MEHVDDLSDRRHHNEPPQLSGVDHSSQHHHDDDQDNKIDRRIELQVIDCCVPVRRVPNLVDELGDQAHQLHRSPGPDIGGRLPREGDLGTKWRKEHVAHRHDDEGASQDVTSSVLWTDTCHTSLETFALSFGFSSVEVSDIDFPNVQGKSMRSRNHGRGEAI